MLYWLPVIFILPYLVLLLSIYRNLLKIKKHNSSSNDPSVFISVIVACRNEEKAIPRLIKCISQQDYPRENFEVIISDDNSADKTFDVASGLCTGNIRVIRNNGAGKKMAINTAVGVASGNLIITTDADCTMGRSWIRTIASYYEQEKASLIICPVRLASIPGFFGKFQELEFLGLQGITAGTALMGNATMCNGANLAFTRESYLKHSENLHYELNTGDDIFLLHSLKKEKHARIVWLDSAEAVVTAAPSGTLRDFFRQRKRWISKANSYDDRYTVILGIVTFVTILIQAAALIAGFSGTFWLMEFLVVFSLKSVPDFLILRNTSERYGNRKLMKWFLPSQLLYPFYVLGVMLYPAAGKISSPSRKET